MTTRTSIRRVTFKRPFVLAGIDGAQPAGSYTVATDEELLDTVARLAFRRVSTQIELHPESAGAGLTEVATIDPGELEAALARDAAGPDPAGLPDGSKLSAPGGWRK